MTRLALVMIVRDEAASIARCLASAAPLVDDIVVLDTGSRDATPALARAHGARVFAFDWCDDFAAARNAALAHAGADWNLVLDGDEWIAPGAGRAALDAVLAGPPCIGVLPMANEVDLQGRVERTTLWLPRLLPRGVRYAGRIHEQPVSNLPRRRIALALGHDGYRAAALARKRGRNAALLARALAETPGQPYLLYQLGKDHEVYRDYAAAAPLYRQALAAGGQEGWRHDLVVRSLFVLKKLGLHEEAVDLAEAEMAHWQDSPDFYFTLGDLLLDWASSEPARAAALLPMVEDCWQRCLALGERPERDGAVAGRGSYLAAHNLVVLYENLGMEEQAARLRPLAVRRS
jgi:glycosyltransferase involved in cell wall biosynthesis